MDKTLLLPLQVSKLEKDMNKISETVSSQNQEIKKLTYFINAQQIKNEKLKDWLPILADVVLYSGRLAKGTVKLSTELINLMDNLKSVCEKHENVRFSSNFPLEIKELIDNSELLYVEAYRCYMDSKKLSEELITYQDLLEKLNKQG
jgi:hypothetical protein